MIYLLLNKIPGTEGTSVKSKLGSLRDDANAKCPERNSLSFIYLFKELKIILISNANARLNKTRERYENVLSVIRT